jgi:heptosyltransferase-2
LFYGLPSRIFHYGGHLLIYKILNLSCKIQVIMPRKLIIMPNWIGDVALALSVIMRKAETERADMTLLVPQHFVALCSLLCGLPILPYKRESRRAFVETIAVLREARFDEAYLLPISFSSAWCAFRAAIPRRRGVSKECRGVLLTEALPGNLRNVNDHLTNEYATVLETPYVPPEAWQKQTSVTMSGPSIHKNALVFCPGSKYGPAKRWPWFGELAKQMSQENIVLLGDQDEAETGNAIEGKGSKHIKNLIGKTTLQEAVAIIAGARLVVSNDSGLMHLAGFLGTPVVAIFGSTSPAWTRPLGSKVRLARIECECSPCFSRTCKYSHYDCLKKIMPEQVRSLAKQLLQD